MSKLAKKVSVILMILLLLPGTALAAGKINTDQDVELTIEYLDGEKALSNVRFDLFQVAEVDEYARMSLSEAFEAYKNTIDGLADLENMDHDKWLELAATLKGYVQRDDLTPAYSGSTDEEGLLSLEIERGLYLVLGDSLTTEDHYFYTATPYMIFLPDEDTENNDWSYTVTTAPKFSKKEPELLSLKVLKQWDDEGYESIRPEEITVQLLKDGKVYDTQVLNGENTWRYTWDGLESDHEWDIVENEVENYEVSIVRSGITFVIRNRYYVPLVKTDPPVQKRITGDTPAANSTFTFVLTAEDASSPVPEGSNGTEKEISIVGAGSKEFGEITFEKPGTYEYTIREKDTGAEGYTYDETVYTLTYEVSEKDGDLDIQLTITDENGKAASKVEFTNRYKTPGELPETGLLWWPVPVLLCAGMILIMVGLIRRRKFGA